MGNAYIEVPVVVVVLEHVLRLIPAVELPLHTVLVCVPLLMTVPLAVRWCSAQEAHVQQDKGTSTARGEGGPTAGGEGTRTETTFAVNVDDDEVDGFFAHGRKENPGG